MGNTSSSIILNTSSEIWCMLKLNNIIYNDVNLNLVAIGFEDKKIIIVNLLRMEIHQVLNTDATVYSLTQFKNDSKYLICSLSDGKLILYIFKGNKYQIHHTLKKPENLDKGEINKVITLSDGNLATAERGAISIWKPILDIEEKKFEFLKEIITDYDTCQLLEVNPNFLACAMYSPKQINVYKKNVDGYLLLGEITNAESHGNNSNGMAKINDKLFCSGGKNNIINIVLVEPVQIIKKIILGELNYQYIKVFT